MKDIKSALVRSILEKWSSYEWTVQGFGFVRTKIEDIGRIHVWDSRVGVPLVSTIHTHPWHLKSRIISGELINLKYIVGSAVSANPNYNVQQIQTGEGDGLIGEPKEIYLEPVDLQIYTAGMVYSQAEEEIHRTIAQDGTVTLIERNQGPPLEEASVFWPKGTHWVSAEPRPAEDWEVNLAVNYALARWAP